MSKPLAEQTAAVSSYIFTSSVSAENIRKAMQMKWESMMRRHREMKRGLGTPYDVEPRPCYFISRPVLMELHRDHYTRVQGDLYLGENSIWYFRGFPVFIIDTHFQVIECHENQTEILYA